MFIKFRARNSGIYLDRGPTRNGVFWVDDTGGWQLASCLAGAVDMSATASRGLCFHLGAVRVEISNHLGLIHIGWSVRDVDLHALSEVLDYLDFFPRGYRVSLEYYCDGWVHEYCGSENVAIRKIIKCQKFRNTGVSDSVFVRDMDNLSSETATPFIRNGLNEWHKGRGLIKSDQILKLLPNLMIYQYRETDGHLMALSRGAGAACRSIFKNDWKYEIGAQPYDYEYPSQRYSDLITQGYSPVLEQNKIGFDHIRASIPQRDGDPRWVAYQRLLLPLTLQDGSSALACLSEISAENAIPVLGGVR